MSVKRFFFRIVLSALPLGVDWVLTERSWMHYLELESYLGGYLDCAWDTEKTEDMKDKRAVMDYYKNSTALYRYGGLAFLAGFNSIVHGNITAILVVIEYTCVMRKKLIFAKKRRNP